MTGPPEQHPIRVFLRLRPLNKLEVNRRSRKVVEVLDGQRVTVEDPSEGDWEVNCDAVFDAMCSQQEVYQETSLKIPQQLVQGFDCCILAYGATATGKTHTLFGASSSPVVGKKNVKGASANGVDGAQGLITRISQGLFNALSASRPDKEFTIRCSVVEIYLERIRDLLNEPSQACVLPSGKLQGCAALSCVTASDITDIVNYAMALRTASSADPNKDSSRSTCVVQLQIEQLDRKTGENTINYLHVYDLAASELVGEPSDEEKSEPAQISQSLHALQEHVRAKADRQARDPSSTVAPIATGPVLTRLLSAKVGGKSYTSVILTASTSNYAVRETTNTLKFGMQCRRVLNRPELYFSEPWQFSHERLVESKERQERLEILVKALATEYQKVRDGDGAVNRKVAETVEQILAIKEDQRRLDFSVETTKEHQSRSKAASSESRIRQQERELNEARSESTQLRSDLAILQAQNKSFREQHAKQQQELSAARHESAASRQRIQEVESYLRTSQFRENEAVVFLRQFRQFYFRLLSKTAALGNGGVEAITSRIPGAPDLTQLADLDQLMMESGLLEADEVGRDAGFKDYRPSPAALQQSTSAAAEASNTALSLENDTVSDGDKDALARAIKLPKLEYAFSTKRKESGESIEARQKLYRTPAGRYIAMRENVLAEELLELSEKCIRLQNAVDEEKTNVEALTGRTGVAAAFDKMRTAQEIRNLKEQLDRKANDLQTIIWKMNENHVVIKNFQDKIANREDHVSYLEENLVGLQNKNGILLADGEETEKKLREDIANLQRNLENTTVAIWHLSGDSSSKPSLATRVVVPISARETPLEKSSERRQSLGEAEEQVEYQYRYTPDGKEFLDAETQTTVESTMEVEAPRNIVEASLFMCDDESSSEGHDAAAATSGYGGLVDAYNSVSVPQPPVAVSRPETSSVAVTRKSSSSVPEPLREGSHERNMVATYNSNGPSASDIDEESGSVESDDAEIDDNFVDTAPPSQPNAENGKKGGKAPPLSLFMNKMRAQADKKKVLDDDEKSTTPEFLKMFRTIGLKNHGESVIEASGQAPSREATRTSFGEVLKHRSVEQDLPGSSHEPLKKWTPRKKKNDDDSDDDSFARDFMKGAQVIEEESESSEDNDDCDSNDGSNGSNASEENEARKESECAPVSNPILRHSSTSSGHGSHVSNNSVQFTKNDDDVIGVADFIDDATYSTIDPPNPYEESNSSFCSMPDSFTGPTTTSKKITESAAGSGDSSEANVPLKSIGDEDDSSDDESAVPSPKKVDEPPKKKSTLDDSDDDSSDDESTSPPPKKVAEPPKESKDDSDDDSSDDESATPPPKTVAEPPKKKSTLDDSDDDSSDDESTSSPPKKVADPLKNSKDDSDDDSLDDKSVTSPPKKSIVGSGNDSGDDNSAAPPTKKAARQLQKDKNYSDAEADAGRKGDSEDDSSSDESAPKKATPLPKKSSDSDDESSDDSTVADAKHAPKKAAAQPKKKAPPSNDSDNQSSDEESAESEVSLAKAATPVQKSSPASKDSDDDSSEDETAAPKGANAKQVNPSDDDSSPLPQKSQHTAASKTSSFASDASDEEPSDEESSVDEATDEVSSGEEEYESSDEESDEESASSIEPETEPQKKPNATSDEVSSGEEEYESSDEESDEESTSSVEPETEPRKNPNAKSSPDVIDLTARSEPQPVDGLGEAFDSDAFGSFDAPKSTEAEVIDVTSMQDEVAMFLGAKSAGFKPRRNVPDFAAQVTPGVTSTADGFDAFSKKKKEKPAKKDKEKGKTKFVIKNGKVVKDDSVPAPQKKDAATPKKEAAKSKFVIKNGKLVKDESGDDGKTSRPSSKLRGGGRSGSRSGSKLKERQDGDKAKAAGTSRASIHTLSKSVGGKGLNLPNGGKKERRLSLDSQSQQPPQRGRGVMRLTSSSKLRGTSAHSQSSRNSKGSRPAFVIKGGKLVKQDAPTPDSTPHEKKKSAAFSIVGGKLVKSDTADASKTMKKGKKEKSATDKKKKKVKRKPSF